MVQRQSAEEEPQPGRPFTGTNVVRRNEYTGRYLVLLDLDDAESGMEALRSSVDIPMVEHVRGTEAESALRMLEDRHTSVVFRELGVAIVDVAPAQRHVLVRAAENHSSIIAAEPERLSYAASEHSMHAPAMAPTSFFPAYRSDEELLHQHSTVMMAASLGPAWDESRYTWGLQAVRANLSAFTGRDIKVAVLSTGVDADHPDLSGRIAGTASFVPGQTVEDGNGHGTHCIGTVGGPAHPQQGPRYGVAPEAQILVGKVLSDRGKGSDGQILAGIAWALSQGAQVISVPLGASVVPGQLFSAVFEAVAQRVVASGALIVAAAGNSGAPVDHPANCPSVLAVGALGKALAVAPFSNHAQLIGGEVDIVAPGVSVHSAQPSGGYGVFSGTSTAASHVAGIAALLAQQSPSLSVLDLKQQLISSALRLTQSAESAGAGLVQAL